MANKFFFMMPLLMIFCSYKGKTTEDDFLTVGKTIEVKATKNIGKERNATTTVTAGKAKPVKINAKQDSPEFYFNVLGSNELQLDAVAKKSKFVVETNVDFKVVSSKPDWCKPEIKPDEESNLVIHIADNFDSKAERKAEVTISADGFDPVTVQVTQRGWVWRVGVYYFDGWAGHYYKEQDKAWMAANVSNAPTHLTRRMVEEFPGREPIWGWRDDSQVIMEQQIDLAADNGVDFFLFCWYWADDNGPININQINSMSTHTSLDLYMKARNKDRVRFGLLIANHEGGFITGPDNWEAGVNFWTQYFNDPQYVTVDGKPLLVIFNTEGLVGDTDGVDNGCITRMQETAKKAGFKDGLSIAGSGWWAKYPEKRRGLTHCTHYNINKGYGDGAESHSYDELIMAYKEQWGAFEGRPYIPVLGCGWDERPWQTPGGREGWYFPDSTPEKFKQFLLDAVQWMKDNPTKTPREKMALVYAWNELGEGGYLVPTKADPNAAKLKMIKSVVEGNY